MLKKTIPLFLFLVAACTSATPGPPPVDIDRLAPLLADMQLAESLVSEVPLLLRDSMRNVFYAGVLKDHNSSHEEFDSLMWIVRQEPSWLDSLYTRAGDELMKNSTE